MGLNDLGRKGRKVVIVTKKEGEPPLNEVDTYISIHRNPTLNHPDGNPLRVKITKLRPENGGSFGTQLTQPTGATLLSGTGVDTTNLASDK